ncbi:unnamed protein product [Pedinophyceae sp. YPF-701]|nr:unnamed protein product [Pedinophyceae sp. YPF-701]
MGAGREGTPPCIVIDSETESDVPVVRAGKQRPARSPTSSPRAAKRRPAPAGEAARDDDEFLCPLGCSQVIRYEEWESHKLAHSLDASSPLTPPGKAQLASQQGGRPLTAVAAAAIARAEAAGPTVNNAATTNPWSIARASAAKQPKPCPAARATPERTLIEPRRDAILAAQRPEPTAICLPDSGVIPLLERALTTQRSGAPEAYLCRSAQHFASVAADRGWGCGYRNIQMLTWHLQRAAAPLRAALFAGDGAVPRIPYLQAWLESAWDSGYDREGAVQLGGRVQGTRKWIGTTEAAAMLRQFGVKAEVFDFWGRQDEEEDEGVADVAHRHGALVRWVWRHFAGRGVGEGGGGGVRVVDRPPLYFQHQGHSRTIVGVERPGGKTADDINLLVLDPQCHPSTLCEALRRGTGWQRLIKRSGATLRSKEYQLMTVRDFDVVPEGPARQQWRRMVAAEVHR